MLKRQATAKLCAWFAVTICAFFLSVSYLVPWERIMASAKAHIPPGAYELNALDLRNGAAEKFNDLAMLGLGLLWAAVLVGKDEDTRMKFRKSPELVIFVCGNLLLLTAMDCYKRHQIMVAKILWNSGDKPLPDLLGDGALGLLYIQTLAVVLGVAFAVIVRMLLQEQADIGGKDED